MKKSSPEDSLNDLWALMRVTVHSMFKIRKKELAKLSITPSKTAVLSHILALGRKAIPAEISRRMFREAHSVSSLLTRMENEKLVRRVKDLEKKNLVRIALTNKGRKIQRQAIRRNTVHEILGILSEAERKQLSNCLLKLREKADSMNGS